MSEAMPNTVKLRLVVLCMALLFACTLESSLNSLKKDFPKYKSELYELKDLMLNLSSAAKDFRYFSGRETDLVDFFDTQGRIPTSRALETKFRTNRGAVMRVQEIVHSIGIDYVSVDVKNMKVWVTMKGGGVLAPDAGYLYVGIGDITGYRLDHYVSIPGDDRWYAFID